MTQKYIIIPARLDSQRLPRKLLLKRENLTVLDHAINNALQALPKENVVLATDSDELADIGKAWKIRTIMTSENHPNGTSRVREAARQLNLHNSDIVVNFQGDCVRVDPYALEFCLDTNHMGIRTCFYRCSHPGNRSDVKVVHDKFCYAKFFSREPISLDSMYNIHVGVYGFRYDTLLETEKYELKCGVDNLEQLTWLWHDEPIRLGEIKYANHIDTQRDYDLWTTTIPF